MSKLPYDADPGPEVPILDTTQPKVRQSALSPGQHKIDHAIRHCGDGGGGSEQRKGARIDVEVIAPGGCVRALAGRERVPRDGDRA